MAAAALLLSLLVLVVRAPHAAAAPSFLTGTEDGVLSGARRCLSSSRKPVLPPSSSQRVMLEESDWHSAYISTTIAAIILKEHLGFDVTFNVPDSQGPTFKRAAFGDFTTKVSLDRTDGAQILDLQATGGKAYYMNMEVWDTEMEKKASAEKYAKSVLQRAGLGYGGREGWFMPAWVTTACKGLTFPSLKNNTSRLWGALQMNGKTVDCPGAGYHANRTLWCPRSGRMLTLETTDSYAVAMEQEIILNNNFDIAMVLMKPSVLEKRILAAVDGSSPGPFQACGARDAIEPFLSYYWEPSPISVRTDLERLLLPTRNCGTLGGGGTGTWICDFQQQKLMKIASKRISRRAPLLHDFLVAFTVPDMDKAIADLDNRTTQATATSDHYWAVACDWVKQNEDLWIEWTATRRGLPGWSMVLDPLNFFLIFFGVFFVLIAIFFLSESLFVSGQSTRKSGNPIGWTVEWEVGLPLVPWARRCAAKAFGGEAAAPKDASKSVPPPGCPLLWAASSFYGRLSDGAVDICLLRFGDEAQLAEALTVHISTKDVTMKAGAKDKAPGYKPLDHAELRFEPNCCAAWTSVPLIDNGFWGPELRFRVVVDGGSARGSRSCTCVVRDSSERRWPGRTLRRPNGFVVWKNLGLVYDLIALVTRLHGRRQELKRIVYCVLAALYDTVGANYLWTVYVIDTCIKGGDRVGLFYAAGVHGIALAFQRLQEWHFTVTGTMGIKLMLKKMATIKAFDAGMDASCREASASCLFNIHNHLVDDSLPVFYGAVYGWLQAFVTLIAAPIYIIAMSMRDGSYEVAQLILFFLVPLFVAMSCSTYISLVRKAGAIDKLLSETNQSHDDYMGKLDEATESRPLVAAYGPESPYDPSAKLHQKGTMHHMKPQMVNLYFRKDTVFMLSSIGTCVYAGALVALALLHIESVEFGSCQFDLSHFLMSILIVTKVNSSLVSLGTHWQHIYEGFHLVVELGDYLNFDCTATEQLATKRQEQLQRLPLGTSVPCGAFMEQIARPLHMECSGAQVPLGRVYLLEGPEERIQDFCADELPAVELPAFAHMVRLTPGLPLHFDADGGMLLESELLAFAEPERFSPEFAGSLRSAVSPLMPRGSNSENKRARTPSQSSDSLTTTEEANSLELLKVRVQQVTQAFLADPEVLCLDSFLDGLRPEHARDLLEAALKWQRGGPGAILGPAPPAHAAADAGSPEWLCRDGGVRRTLLLHLRPYIKSYVEAMLEPLPRINVEDSAPRVVEPRHPEEGMWSSASEAPRSHG